MINEQSLRILQIGTWDIAGGAEKVAWELFDSYRTLGYNSWLCVGNKISNDMDVFTITSRLNTFSRVIPSSINIPHAAYIRKRIEFLANPNRICDYFKGHEDFDHPSTWSILDKTPEPPDILHCHNLHGGYFDLRALPWLSHQIPTILTLHDAWLLSGHCAHSFGCERWKIGCGNCPDLSIYPAICRDATAYNWHRKAEIYKNSQLYVVTPSQWLMDKVNKSMLKPGIKESRIIPNGVNLKIFHPSDQMKARVDLGLPADTNIILFAANGIRNNIWKDYNTLQSALEEIAKARAKVLCIALGEEAPSEHIGTVKINFVPYQRDPENVARYQQAADIYVHPARAEVWGLTITEALACGTPVVASKVGGIPEQVVEGRTGFLVPIGDAHAMAERILCLLADEKLRGEIGRQAAEDAAQRFGLERMTKDYMLLYENISH